MNYKKLMTDNGGFVGCGKGIMYLMSLGHPADIGLQVYKLQLGKGLLSL